ncbi:IucA/IucC family protein [Streptomyces sp. HNM0575]|uniref:IucA/IucC family protein n=1 Tax=Streptomyces sp. HNM0575 TaxID=2716338 RepID=UPI00321780FB
MNAPTGAAPSVPQAPRAPEVPPGTDVRAPADPATGTATDPAIDPATDTSTAPAADASTTPVTAPVTGAATTAVTTASTTASTAAAVEGARLPAQTHAPGRPRRALRTDTAGPAGGAAPQEPEDPARTADDAATGNLLCCWVRERNIPRPAGRGAGSDAGTRETLVLAMEASGVTLRVPVRHWSPTGRHDFGPPLLDGAPAGAAPLDAVTLAALIAREAAHLGGGRAGGASADGSGRGNSPAVDGCWDAHGADAPIQDPDGSPVERRDGGPSASGAAGAADLVARVADSVRRTAGFLAERRAAPEPPPGHGPFIEAEQSLVLGHPLHPAPKSRQGLSDDESAAYSPEVRAAFPLHWVAVHESVLACDSAWTERGRTVGAAQLAARLAGETVTSRLPSGTVPLPLHPWQARRLAQRTDVARLFADGLLQDLGEAGGPWHPTSSVRTVMRPGGPAMLKLSLALPITNSRRENLRKELLRGLEMHRLLRSGLGAQWRAAHPGFDIVRDPAWLGVDGPDGLPVTGLDTVIRHNPFGPADDAVCVAGLTAERPSPVAPYGRLRSRLADVLEGLAARTDRPVRTVATEWFLRYLDAVVRPVLWLDAHAGIALEAHQQNTLVLLDEEGWPCGGRYRDNQGYYFRESRRDALQQRLAGARLGVDSDTFVGDEVADERFAYYLGINNVLGLIGALGVQRLADERVLIAAARQFLRTRARGDGDGPVSALPELLLESPTLRCKANLLTRVHGMDELVGPVDTQSVYVTVANPLFR